MRIIPIAFVFCTAASLCPAQEVEPHMFPSRGYFRTVFTPPQTRVELRPPVRLEEFVVGDKLELSLKNYLDLVMSNNPDIQVQKLSVEIQKNAITRAFGAFDPTVTASFNSTRTKSQTGDVLAGAATLNQLSQPFNAGFTQRLATSTQLTANFSTTKTSTNSTFQNYNPLYSSQVSFGFSQPLLRGRGPSVVKLPITLARSRLASAQANVEDQLLRLIATAENAYWQVILERENLKVQEKGLENLATQLKRNQRELELGAISPLDIYNPQAQYEQQRIQVSQAKYRLMIAEDALRRQMGADLDPRFRDMPIVLTENPDPGATPPSFDREELVQKAQRRRPDIRAQLQALVTDDISIQQAQNTLRPDLTLTGSYAGTGRGGNFYQRGNVFTSDGTQVRVLQVIPGGVGDALHQMFTFNYPIYQFGLRLTLPLRDRSAAANLADALVNKKLNAYRLRSLEQSVRLDVLNAITQVESSKASIEIAKVGLDLAQKQLDAEQKKYDLGTTTIFFVLDAQTRLVNAQSVLVNQTVQYRRNLVTLLQRTGELLEARGIVVQ